jgi:hypothetical protein
MYIAFILGTAGSGKSLLVGSFVDWLKEKGRHAIKVNLDPGALTLPYTPDVDVRDYVLVTDLMERYGLGPNGALVMAADLIATRISEIKTEIEELNPDYVIVDTSGQMELFAFRESGPYIVKELTDDPKAIVYLFDAAFSSDPLNYVSNLFLATAVHSRFILPQVSVLSKVDLISREKAEEVLSWSEDEANLIAALEATVAEERRLLSEDVLEAISRLGYTFELVPVSAKTREGFLNLFGYLTRIFSGGEEII